MSITNHTPTPWHTSTNHSITAGPDPRVGMTIARLVNVSQDANAALIVRAVNAHDALVAALTEAQAHLEFTGYGDRYEREVSRDLPGVIAAALKLARG